MTNTLRILAKFIVVVLFATSTGYILNVFLFAVSETYFRVVLNCPLPDCIMSDLTVALQGAFNGLIMGLIAAFLIVVLPLLTIREKRSWATDLTSVIKLLLWVVVSGAVVGFVAFRISRQWPDVYMDMFIPHKVIWEDMVVPWEVRSKLDNYAFVGGAIWGEYIGFALGSIGLLIRNIPFISNKLRKVDKN